MVPGSGGIRIMFFTFWIFFFNFAVGSELALDFHERTETAREDSPPQELIYIEFAEAKREFDEAIQSLLDGFVPLNEGLSKSLESDSDSEDFDLQSLNISFADLETNDADEVKIDALNKFINPITLRDLDDQLIIRLFEAEARGFKVEQDVTEIVSSEFFRRIEEMDLEVLADLLLYALNEGYFNAFYHSINHRYGSDEESMETNLLQLAQGKNFPYDFFKTARSLYRRPRENSTDSSGFEVINDTSFDTRLDFPLESLLQDSPAYLRFPRAICHILGWSDDDALVSSAVIKEQVLPYHLDLASLLALNELELMDTFHRYDKEAVISCSLMKLISKAKFADLTKAAVFAHQQHLTSGFKLIIRKRFNFTPSLTSTILEAASNIFSIRLHRFDLLALFDWALKENMPAGFFQLALEVSDRDAVVYLNQSTLGGKTICNLILENDVKRTDLNEIFSAFFPKTHVEHTVKK